MSDKKLKMPCKCIDKVNALIRPSNRELVLSHFLTLGLSFMVIETQKIDSKKRDKNPVSLIPTYCPFCAKKLPVLA